MTDSIRIHIPSKNDALMCSAYSHGIVADIQSFQQYTEYIYLERTSVILNYSYPVHRRAYIIYPEAYTCFDRIKLPYVTTKAGFLAQLTGRRIDRLENTLYHLERLYNYTFYSFAPAMFLKLAAAIQTSALTRKEIESMSILYAKEFTLKKQIRINDERKA